MTLETVNVTDPAKTGDSSQSYSASPDISPEEQDTVRALMKKFWQWKKVRDKVSKPWINYHKLYRGQQWSGKRPKWKNSEIVNLIWQTVQSSAPLQTDARPKFIFLPQNPQDLQFAELMEKVCEADWERWGWMQSVLEVILDGYIIGTGISSMHYDHSKLYGMGAPCYVSEEPFYIFPDPDSNDFNDEKSDGVFKACPITTEKVKRKYPAKAHLIKTDTKDWLKDTKINIKNNDFYEFYQSTTMELPEETLGGSAKDNDIPKTLLIEWFGKPKDIEQIVTNEMDEAGNEKKKYTVKSKYPNGRYICIANGVILHDGPLPYEDGLIPFSKYVNYSDPRQFWGISEVEQLESPQRAFNKILSYALDIMLYCSNPQWVISNDADVDTDNMTNQPGAIIEKSPSGTVERIQGAQLPPQFMQMLDRLVGWFNDTAGQSDFSRGEAPGSVTAASAIEQLISASRTRIRQKQRNLDIYLRDAGRQYLNRVLQYYTIPRIFRITGKDGTPYWMKMSVEKITDDSGDQLTAAIIQSYDKSPNGQVVVGEPQRIFLRGELDIRVQAGSDLPFEAADKERKSLALFNRQIIDAEEVMDQIQYPNKEKVLARMAQRMQEAQAQAQQTAMEQQNGQAQAMPQQGAQI
jgi:hypothetical protein